MSLLRPTMMSAALLITLAGSCLAGVPAALDRIPLDTPIVIGIANLQEFHDKVLTTMKSVGLPMDEGGDNPIKGAEKILNAPGINKMGSMAIAVYPDSKGAGGGSEDAPGVVIVPVSDFAALVKAMGGQPGDKVASVKFDDKDGFARDLTGGYAVIGIDKAMVESFDGKAGHRADHEKHLGSSGRDVADRAEVLFIANIEQLQGQLKQASQGLKQQMEMMAMMAPPGAGNIGGTSKMAQSVLDAFSRDASVGIMGIDVGETGLALDFATQFKEGSASAGMFNGKGTSGAILSHLPVKKYLIAGAIDTSSSGVKTMIKNMAAMNVESKKAAENADKSGKPDKTAKKGGGDDDLDYGFMNNLAKTIDMVDGQGFILGASDMGAGLLTQALLFTSTKSSAKILDSTKEMYAKLNGKTVEGVKLTTEFTPDAKEVGGVKVNTYTMKMESDPNDPNAMAMGMMQGMLFGGEGSLSGMIAPASGGIMQTMSMNTPLLTSALESAKTGKGLGDDKNLRAVQAMLPADRSFEMYIGTREVIETVEGVMAMMGGAPELKLPESLPPIGIGGTTDGGAFRLRIALPNDVLKAISEIGTQMKNGGDGMDGGDEKPEKKSAPKF